MAIRRCPYCKAIIDEGSEYCSNCGTQLLFPEDEYIHEEVPGDKIVEEETPEEENPKKWRSSLRRRKKKEEQQELEPAEAEEDAEAEKEKDVEEEVEFEPLEEGTDVQIEEEKMDDVDKSDAEEIIEESQIEEEPQDEEKPPEEERDEFFVEKQDPAFGTEDLEKVIDPEEKEKAEIEKFLKSLKEDRNEWNGEIPPTDELPPWAEKIKDEKPDDMPAVEADAESESGEEIKEFEEPKEELPVEEEQAIEEEKPLDEDQIVDEEHVVEEKQPVEGAVEEEFPPIMDEKGAEEKEEVLEPIGLTPEDEVPEVEIPEEEAEEELAEEEKVEEELAEVEVSEEEAETMPDTGMGLPEGVEQEQENLLFTDQSPGLFASEEKSPPSKLSTWLKSRAFDVLFIGALWIVALHIASRMLSTNLFKLISVSVFPSVAFYLALLAAYLFLFFLFLGQTLGDHLFPYEE